jgi:hypothetical protein
MINKTNLASNAEAAIANCQSARTHLAETLQSLKAVISDRHSKRETAEANEAERVSESVLFVDASIAEAEKMLRAVAETCGSGAGGLPVYAGECKQILADMARNAGTLDALIPKLASLGLTTDAERALEDCKAAQKTLSSLEAALRGLTTEVLEIESALDNCRRLETRIDRDRKMMADANTELHALKHTADLGNESTLGRVSQILAIQAIGPERSSAHYREFDSARTSLIQVCNAFIKTALGPRYRELERRALAKVGKQLQASFTDPDSLRTAAHHSSVLTELRPIEAATVQNMLQVESREKLAERSLRAWSDCEAFENKHLSKAE